MKRQIPDNPALRDALTPHYRAGCKRILLSNEYFKAYTRPNVELVRLYGSVKLGVFAIMDAF